MLFKVMEFHNWFPSFNFTGLIESRGMQWATSVLDGNGNCEQKFRRINLGDDIKTSRADIMRVLLFRWP
jgi:hypothetical protein